MKIRTVRHLWGVEEAWETALPKIRDNGYYAIETPLHFLSAQDKRRLALLLEKNGLKLINQIHTDSYLPGKRSKDVEHHIQNFKDGLETAKQYGAVFCNSHSGYEGWTNEQKEHFFSECLRLEKEYGINVCHETHRRRIFYNPWDTRDILLKFPDLKVTADLSHFFVVLSNNLDEEMDIIKLIAERTLLIHARVGYDNGPQVNDPRAEENLEWVEAHERCWDEIWKSQHRRNLEFTYLEPEFGPPSYMHTLPFTQVPVTNLWEICEWQTKRQVERFHKSGY